MAYLFGKEFWKCTAQFSLPCSDGDFEKAVQIDTENNDPFSDGILLFCLLNQILISDWIGEVTGKRGASPRPDTGSQSGPEHNIARSLIGQRPLPETHRVAGVSS